MTALGGAGMRALLRYADTKQDKSVAKLQVSLPAQ